MKGNKEIPSDLVVVVGLVLLTDIFILVPFLSETAFRILLAIPMLLFLPGYALVAALFILKQDLSGIERAALSFGLSIAVVPLLCLGLNYSPWEIRLLPILISLSLFILSMCGIAYLRRKNLAKEEVEAYEVSFKEAWISLKAELLEKPESTWDKVCVALLIISILASIITVVYVIVTPKEGEPFTEFYILGSEGKADNYPRNYAPEESRTVIVGIVNHEYRTLNYTLDIRLDNFSLTPQKDREHISLEHNETWERNVNITPPFEGTDMKLEFLLFNDTEKTEPYRDLYFWINVTNSIPEPEASGFDQEAN